VSATLRWIAIAVVAVLLLIALSSIRSCTTAKTETKLAKSQAGAAIESGTDAVETVGNRAQSDATTDAITSENDNAIRNAEGANAPVAAGARDAGFASLCRRAVYRSDPKCVQHAHP